MNDVLEIELLGGLTIRRGGAPVTGFASRKAGALLAYLACTGRPHPREVLATMFWDERSQAQAMANLRVVLSSLHHLLGLYITITQQTVAFNRESPHWLDVEAFHQGVREALRQRVHETSGPRGNWLAYEPTVPLTAERAALLAGAVRLYQGDFLAGFHVRDAPDFEEWVVMEREWLRRVVTQALGDLVAWHLKRGDYPTTIAHATHLLRIDPLSEETHRQLMSALARSGQRVAGPGPVRGLSPPVGRGAKCRASARDDRVVRSDSARSVERGA
jgi:DNA-binding SARP family transcriptional activator